ncbi:MAG TPA: hypothetical protein VKB15_07280 [Xanthobacteraceae bacterium]|nr:hypothetical protein [Xanthobacteraceae bacterium]
MSTGELHEDISRLELRIEQLANTIERCRKIVLIAKIAIAVGGVLMLALLLGAIRFNPVAMIAAMTLAIGGIVVFGSNTSTSKQAAADLSAAETLRAELIGRIDLRVVGLPDL